MELVPGTWGTGEDKTAKESSKAPPSQTNLTKGKYGSWHLNSRWLKVRGLSWPFFPNRQTAGCPVDFVYSSTLWGLKKLTETTRTPQEGHSPDSFLVSRAVGDVDGRDIQPDVHPSLTGKQDLACMEVWRDFHTRRWKMESLEASALRLVWLEDGLSTLRPAPITSAHVTMVSTANTYRIKHLPTQDGCTVVHTAKCVHSSTDKPESYSPTHTIPPHARIQQQFHNKRKTISNRQK